MAVEFDKKALKVKVVDLKKFAKRDDSLWSLYVTGKLDPVTYVGYEPFSFTSMALSEGLDLEFFGLTSDFVAQSARFHRTMKRTVGIADPAGHRAERQLRSTLAIRRTIQFPALKALVLSVLRSAVLSDAPNLGPIEFGSFSYDPGPGDIVLLDAIHFDGHTFCASRAKALLRSEDNVCPMLWNHPASTDLDVLTALALNAEGCITSLFNLRRKKICAFETFSSIEPESTYKRLSSLAKRMPYFKAIRHDQGPSENSDQNVSVD